MIQKYIQMLKKHKKIKTYWYTNSSILSWQKKSQKKSTYLEDGASGDIEQMIVSFF